MEARAAWGAPISFATAMGRLGLSVPCAASAIGNFEQLRRGSVLERGRREEEEEGNAVAGLVGFLCLLGLFRVHLGCAAMGYNWKGPNKALAFKEDLEGFAPTHCAIAHQGRREGKLTACDNSAPGS